MSLEKMTCGVNYTTNLLRDNVNGLIDNSGMTVNSPLLTIESYEDAVIVDSLESKTLAKTWIKDGEFISNVGAEVVQAGEFFPDSGLLTGKGTVDFGTGNPVNPSYVRGFYFYGDKFEMKYKETLSTFIIFVDGKKAGEFSAPSTGLVRYFSVTFPDSRVRRIEIVCVNAMSGDLYTDNIDTVYKTDYSKKVVVVGDSITEGSSADKGYAYLDQLRYLTGNFNIYNSGSGGTGYFKGNNGRPPLVDRYQTDVVDVNPDIVIIAMGINDTASEQTEQAISQTISGIKSSLQSSRLIVLGAYTDGDANANMLSITNSIKSVCESEGVEFINPTGTGNADGWFTGTGKEDSQAGDGNADVFISTDGTHPNNEGHSYMARRLLQSLSSVGLDI